MWLIFALLTAFFTSLQDVFGKKVVGKVDIYVAAWAWIFFSLPLTLSLLPFVQPAELGPHFWKAVIAATIFLTVAILFYFKAIKESDLSLAIPLLTLTPLLLLISSPIMVGEFPSPFGLVGILLIVAGAYVLNIKQKSKGYFAPFKALIEQKGSRCMLVVAVLFSISANIDKIGVQNSSFLTWIVVLNVSLVIVFTGIMLYKSKDIIGQIRSVFPWVLLLGSANAMALIFNMITIQMTLVPYLIAVKRTSVLMSSLFGFFLFKERGLRERLLGVVLMILGIFLIVLAT